MRLRYTEPFLEAYSNFPEKLKKQVDKQLKLLLQNPRHPSLQARKLKSDPTGKTWYGRITKRYRFTFEIEHDVYTLRTIGPHDKIL